MTSDLPPLPEPLGAGGTFTDAQMLIFGQETIERFLAKQADLQAAKASEQDTGDRSPKSG